MPLYDFNCPDCSANVEVWLKIEERNSSQKCPECSSIMERTINGPAFHLKGNGWYVTDYKNNKTPKNDGV